jgi:hypothetical protein
MKQSSYIKLVDLLSFVVLILMISTGLFLEFTLPERSRSASVFGYTRHQWGDFHYWVSVGFLVCMLLHLVQHIKYLKSAITGKASREQRYRLAAGFFGLIALLAVAFAPLVSPIQPHQTGGKHRAKIYSD